MHRTVMGELYACLKKFAYVLIALILDKALQKTIHHWTPQAYKEYEIFIWYLYIKQDKSYRGLFMMQ